MSDNFNKLQQIILQIACLEKDSMSVAKSGADTVGAIGELQEEIFKHRQGFAKGA